MGSRSPKGKGFRGVVRPTEKHCESLLMCTQQKINNRISATSATDCIASDGPISH